MNLYGDNIELNDMPEDGEKNLFTAIGYIDGRWVALNVGPVDFRSAKHNAVAQNALFGRKTKVSRWEDGYPQLHG